MGRAIKLILYYFAYQLVFLFVGTAADAAIVFIQRTEIPTDFQPGIATIVFSTFLSALAMTWHLIHFNYVRIEKKSLCEIPAKTILLSIPLVISALFLSSVLNEILGLPDHNQDVFVGMSHRLFGILSIALVSPVMEELLFRGAIEGHLLRKGWTPKWAIAVSALIFGLIHLNPAQIPFAFLIGLVFGWLFYRTGSVIPGLIGHILNNSCVAWYMASSTREELTKTTVEIWGTSLTYMLMVLAGVIFAGMWFYLNKHLPHYR